MSILLESLTQKNDAQNGLDNDKIPDIHSTHFDDELLGDERLLKRLKIWQLLTYTLGIMLVASWCWIYLSGSITPSPLQQSTVQVPEQTSILPNKAILSQAINPTQQTEPVQNQAASTQQITSVQPELSDESEAGRSVYKPKKHTKPAVKPENRSSRVADNQMQPEVERQSDVTAKSLNNSSLANSQTATPAPKPGTAVVTKNELPDSLQSEFPNIQINSYVVAENVKDSFVILDGAFYKVNQVIAPNLILRDISKQHIVVEYHSYLVKIPLN
ncbi:hypothetical protein [Aliikangiella maris]|uniref:General secretion pathway protein B n=2 Tax=Aliikangiella maris TaxID=3162458 RepID=A0ABV3MLH2_9GAMM